MQRGPLKEENLIKEVNPNHQLQEPMQQMPKKKRQKIRTDTKGILIIEVLAEIVTKTKVQRRGNQEKRNG